MPNLDYNPSIQFPTEPIPFSFDPTFTFTVPQDVAPYIPTFDFSEFNVTAEFGLVGQATLQGTLEVQGGTNTAILKGEIVFNVSLELSFQITDPTGFLNILPFELAIG